MQTELPSKTVEDLHRQMHFSGQTYHIRTEKTALNKLSCYLDVNVEENGSSTTTTTEEGYTTIS